jgi:hypothetical protein
MSTPPRTARIVVDDRTARIVVDDRTARIVIPFPNVEPPASGDAGQLDFSNVNNSAWIGAV